MRDDQGGGGMSQDEPNVLGQKDSRGSESCWVLDV